MPRFAEFSPLEKIRPAFLLLPVFLAGCANTAVVDTWRGHRADDLVAAWGPASSAQRLDDGRRVVAYEHVSAFLGMSYHCKAVFVVDPAGRIASATVDGDNGGCDRMLRDKPAAP